MFKVLVKISKVIMLVLTLSTLFAGCATSPKVQVVQAGDNSLTKEQLLCEIDKLKEAEANVESKRGVNGTNVAAAVLFWPGLVYTHMDAGEATRLIEQRKNHLTNLYNLKAMPQKDQKPTRLRS